MIKISSKFLLWHNFPLDAISSTFMEAMPHIPDLSGPTKNHVWASALLKDFNLDEDRQINYLTKQPTSQSLSGTIKSHKKNIDLQCLISRAQISIFTHMIKSFNSYSPISKVQGVMSLFYWCFWSTGALMGTPRVADVWCGLPGCRWDWMKQKTGCGAEFEVAATLWGWFSVSLGSQRMLPGCEWD